MKTRRDTGFWILNPVRTIVSSVDILMLLPISRSAERRTALDCICRPTSRAQAIGAMLSRPAKARTTKITILGFEQFCDAASRTLRSSAEGRGGWKSLAGTLMFKLRIFWVWATSNRWDISKACALALNREPQGEPENSGGATR
jgi:hypothetical protein